MNEGMNNPGVVRIVVKSTEVGFETALSEQQIESLKRCDVLEVGNEDSGFYRYYPCEALDQELQDRNFTNMKTDASGELFVETYAADFITKTLTNHYSTYLSN